VAPPGEEEFVDAVADSTPSPVGQWIGHGR